MGFGGHDAKSAFAHPRDPLLGIAADVGAGRFGTGARPWPRRRTRGLAHHISMYLSVRMIENDLFEALADPTRRATIEKLAGGGMNASALREGMEISQPVMSRHLAVLRGARLVREQRSGRFVNDEVDPDGVALIADG
jgi:DNA-binding transcriptional ArsR family regulator